MERTYRREVRLVKDVSYNCFRNICKEGCKLELSNKLLRLTILALVTDSEASLSKDDDRIKMLLFLFLLAIDEIGRDLPIFGLGRGCGSETEYTSSRVT